MHLIKQLNIELNILKIELKDAIVTSHKDNIIRKMEAIHAMLDLYESK